MTTKSAAATPSKQDAKYLALIGEYQREIKVILADLKRSRGELKRMHRESERRLARIDTLLNHRA